MKAHRTFYRVKCPGPTFLGDATPALLGGPKVAHLISAVPNGPREAACVHSTELIPPST